MAKNRFVPLTRKINSILLAALVIGIGSISFYSFRSVSGNIERFTETGLAQQSGYLYRLIENLMLAGEAPVAEQFFSDVKRVNPDYSIRLFRTNGVEAFTDNSTIETVNANIGRRMFQPRDQIPASTGAPVQPYFDKATRVPPPSTNVRFQQDVDGSRLVSLYQPLINLPKCTGCHGPDHTIRGVIELQNDITYSVMRQRENVYVSAGLFLGMVIALALVLAFYLRRTVISPVQVIGKVCAGVTNGDFTQKVRVSNNDEIGRLGTTVNTMVDGLYERLQLSKYVSSSTLRSLRGSNHGTRTVMTVFFSDIRGFTSYSEGKQPETVVSALNGILNYQTEIVHRRQGDVDKYVGDEIVALYTGSYAELRACETAADIQRGLQAELGDQFDDLTVGIGVNTGEVILGMLGSEKRADYTVIGDAVNTASRLCDVAKAGQIVISDSVYRAVKDYVEASGPYRLRVKGKRAYLRVYILDRITDVPSDFEDRVSDEE
jgi:class 3 adenylate cyclase